MTNIATFTKSIESKETLRRFLTKVGELFPESTIRTPLYWDDLNEILNEVQN